jgi:glyoxylase-like metal-dependent hydrolase (beta-lactamase superfamily II)
MKEFFLKNSQVDCDQAVHLGSGVWWVGFQDESSGLHCNPYLIIDGDEAVVIDGGSRPDFPSVMMKILETGLNPAKISALIYDHYDPDLCGSIPNFEEMIGRPDLKLITTAFSETFIRHYGARGTFSHISKMGYRFVFKSGREFEFITTPYCHSRGSFVIFDRKTKILFSADLFGTYDKSWQLFMTFPEGCCGLLLYTDGLTECVAPDGSFYGEERLMRSLAANLDQPAAAAADAIFDAARAFAAGTSYKDDFTMLLLQSSDQRA